MRVQVRGGGTPVRRMSLEPGESRDILLDAQGITALTAALEDAEADPNCRVMVLEGTPGSFCGGMDLGSAASVEGDDFSVQAHEFAHCLAMMRGSGRVVISVVDGDAVGGGVGLAAAADICIASDRSTFALPELVLGLLPAIILPVLLERLPPQKVRLLCLSTGIGGGEALAWGLVDRLVEDSSELEKALLSAIKHCLRCSPGSVAELKDLQGRWEHRDLREALEAGAGHLAQIIDREETAQALQAFLDGGSLPWFDRYRPKGNNP